MRKWIGFIAIGGLLVVLMSLAACTKSKLPPATTLVGAAQATVSAELTPGAGTTVVVADATPTTTVGVSPTPIPTFTPTTEAGETVTPTVEASPTPVVETTPEPSTGAEFDYVVKTGDTLWGLALRFGTTVQAIKTRNGLVSDIIYKDQKLVLAGTAGDSSVTHIVQPGENLYRIALKYGTTIQAIAAANNIINPNWVYAGQKLIVVQGSGTTPGGGVRYHVVQPGETLSSIAMRYGTTPWKIAAANGIANINFIYAGRTLRIP